MISHQQAEEIAERYRAMGARDCTAEMVMKFLAPTVEQQVDQMNQRIREVRAEELEGEHA